jgi:hypothetical protein
MEIVAVPGDCCCGGLNAYAYNYNSLPPVKVGCCEPDRDTFPRTLYAQYQFFYEPGKRDYCCIPPDGTVVGNVVIDGVTYVQEDSAEIPIYYNDDMGAWFSAKIPCNTPVLYYAGDPLPHMDYAIIALGCFDSLWNGLIFMHYDGDPEPITSSPFSSAGPDEESCLPLHLRFQDNCEHDPSTVVQGSLFWIVTE